MAKLHETGFGKRFFDVQLPQLIEALEGIGSSLKSIEGNMTQKVSPNMETHEIKPIRVDPTKSWTNNEIQFARVISEMVSQLEPEDLDNIKHDMAESMNLTRSDLDKLFIRAEGVWERTKAVLAGVSYY